MIMKSAIIILSLLFILFTALNTAGNETKEPAYVGSETCQACHPEIYDAWNTSKHAADFKTEREITLKCNGCHTTGVNAGQESTLENNIGCEACHGPGEEHISSGGDIKLVSSNSADICGRCHNGNRSGDDITWITEYTPGMNLSNVKGLNLISVSPDKTPPFFEDIHPSLTYNMWLVSGHAKTPDRDIEVRGEKWDGPVTCSACHNPHSSDHPSQLAMDARKLCRSCHFQGAVLRGFGAKGIEETRALHTAAPCISCHMTEKNHLMKMLRPDDPTLSEKRLDSCSDCHEVKDRKMRSAQLLDMEAWYSETMEPVQKLLKIVEEHLKKNPDILNAKLKTKLEDVKANLSIIQNDGSNGVHNLDYALEIMYLAKKDLKKIVAAVQ